jgi:hypothetical protein
MGECFDEDFGELDKYVEDFCGYARARLLLGCSTDRAKNLLECKVGELLEPSRGCYDVFCNIMTLVQGSDFIDSDDVCRFEKDYEIVKKGF